MAAEKLQELNAQLTDHTDIPEICSYYGAYSRQEYLALHLLPNPYQHQNLTDEEMLWLIGQMQDDVADDALWAYYGTILDINTSSPSETSVTSIDPGATAQEILTGLNKGHGKK